MMLVESRSEASLEASMAEAGPLEPCISAHTTEASPEASTSEAGQPAPYARGQLVWAKLQGFPWWPARVRRVERIPPAAGVESAEPLGAPGWRARIRFCGTSFGDSRDFANIGCGHTMFGFEERLAEWGAKMPYSGKSKVLRKQWKKAVDEARAAPAMDVAPDEEERAEAEAAAAEAAEAAEEAAADAAIWAEGWKTEGHELMGVRVARRFQGIGGGRPYLGTITRWLPPLEPATDPSVAAVADGEESAPPAARDGDTAVGFGTAVGAEGMEVDPPAAAAAAAAVSAAEGGASAEDSTAAPPVVPKEVGDDEVLFHIVMDDGDEEDLEQFEVDAALALWRGTAEGVRTARAEARAADGEWAAAEREARRAARKARGHDGVVPPMPALALYKRHVEVLLLGEAVDASLELAEVLGFAREEYEALSEAERAPFERRAKRDRLRYHRERRLKRKRAAAEKKKEQERERAAAAAMVAAVTEAAARGAAVTEAAVMAVAGLAAAGVSVAAEGAGCAKGDAAAAPEGVAAAPVAGCVASAWAREAAACAEGAERVAEEDRAVVESYVAEEGGGSPAKQRRVGATA